MRFWSLLLLLGHTMLRAQTLLEGYVFEEKNRGFLPEAKVTVYALSDNVVQGELTTDAYGKFTLHLARGTYRIAVKKDNYRDLQDTFQVLSDAAVYRKLEMRRKPGYLFDATLAEARENPDQIVDAVTGAWIEIYNRTEKRPIMSLREHPHSFFKQYLEPGNHYTMLIRKPGFLAKRIEAYVNIKGCIICIDGVREVSPGVTDNLTAGNSMGTLLANIELERAKINKRIQLNIIYYDYDQWQIRNDAAEQLDKVVVLMKDNPDISVELGSHTDARGNDNYNLKLSQRRAESAVAYIVEHGIAASRITAKGYGETQLSNRCANGVACSETDHQQNRRTELRITGVLEGPNESAHWKSLEELLRQ